MEGDLRTLSLDSALLREGLITRPQLEEAREERYRTERTLPAVLTEMGALTERVLLEFFRDKMGFEIISLRGVAIEPNIYELIPQAFARHKRLIPVRLEYDALALAMEDPSDFHLVEDLNHRLGLMIKPMAASASDIDAALEKYPEPSEEAAKEAAPRSAWNRALASVFFPVMLALPLIVIFVLMIQDYSPKVRNTLYGWINQRYDFTIQFTVLFGIWSCVFWLVNGLLFPPEPSAKSQSAREP